VAQGLVNLHGVVFQSGYFVAVGDSGTVLTSPDGLNWTLRSAPGGAALNGIAFGNGVFVAVGLSGNIWQSAPILSLGVAWAPGGANLTLAAPSGLPCVVQASNDLIHWTNLFSIPFAQSTQTLTDTNAPAYQQRFYRAMAQ
jgi:hypothetical protein